MKKSYARSPLLSVTVTLKSDKGHQNWCEVVKLYKDYNHAKSEKSHLKSLREKAGVKVHAVWKHVSYLEIETIVQKLTDVHNHCQVHAKLVLYQIRTYQASKTSFVFW